MSTHEPNNQKSSPVLGFRGPLRHGPVQRAKNFKGTVRALLSELGAYVPALILALLFALAGTLFSIAGPRILGMATTTIFTGMTDHTGTGAGIDFFRVGQILFIATLLYLISALAMFAQGFILSTVTQRLARSMRSKVNEKIHRMSLRSFDLTTHGDILSRVTNDIDTVGQNLNQGLVQVLISAVTLLGTIVMMLIISPIMTFVTFGILPVAMLFISKIAKHSQKQFVAQQKKLGELNGQVEEVYSGHVVVKAFGAEHLVGDRFEETNADLFESAWKSQFLSGLMMPVMQGIGDVGYVAIALLGGALAVGGSISVGDIQAFIQYIRNFMHPLAQVAQVTNLLQSTVAAAERVFEFLASEEESDTEIGSSPRRLFGRVEFEHVKFGYDPELPVIHDFTASISSGMKVAIVGPTGAGKSTLVKLLMRFYDLQGGIIRIDGHDIATLSRTDVRSSFGIVLQDAWLFSGTIRENIRYGRLDASDEEVARAAQAARIDHFIHTLPEGYDMMINEESSNISQGQRQLVTIARAILADPGILILDEATSNVDTRTEVLIQEAMDHLMAGRTSFIIAHRLSTIRNADVILVMRDGDIVEQGTHEQLLEKRGFYADLHAAQFETIEPLVS